MPNSAPLQPSGSTPDGPTALASPNAGIGAVPFPILIARVTLAKNAAPIPGTGIGAVPIPLLIARVKLAKNTITIAPTATGGITLSGPTTTTTAAVPVPIYPPLRPSGGAGSPTQPPAPLGSGAGAVPFPILIRARRSAVAPPPPAPPPPYNSGGVGDVTVTVSDAQLRISWAASGIPGQHYQVYIDRALVWTGTATYCVVPYPTGPITIDVGAVATSSARSNLAASLPSVSGGGSRIALRWQGGLFLGDAAAAFHVYLGSSPGAAPNLSGPPSASITAYPQGLVADGFGSGGFGSGGFGSASTVFTWTSPHIAPGVWDLAVVPVDAAGNAGPPTYISQTIDGPPPPPARNAQGLRLTATPGRLASPGPDSGGYGQGGYGVGGYGVGGLDGAPFVTLNWLAPNGS